MSQEITTKNGTMKQKTVYEKNGYNGKYYMDNEPKMPEVGKKYFVTTNMNVSPNALQSGNSFEILDWTKREDFIENGYPGNMNHEIRKFHGWRGTTSDNSIMACGVRYCTKSEIIEYKKTYHVVIEFGIDEKLDCE